MLTALILNTFFLLTPLERPTLVVAQGYIESGMNVSAKGKAGERGAFQVKPKDWGKVPKKWKDQADQNEKIIKELLEAKKGNFHKTVVAYNGKGKKADRYARKVFAKALSIHLLDIA